jgi:peptidoglycan/xylan/chitin deacetylase (PgdA/CDA1 family)
MQFAPIYPFLYKILRPSFPNCLWSGAKNQKAIALTFDDGPHPQYTPELLKVLDHYNIPASFFWLGVCVNRAPAVARLVASRGHGIGLHGYEHRSFVFLSPDELKQSLAKTQLAVAQACNMAIDAVRDVRPPNGVFTPKTINLLEQWNYRPVMWSVVPEDWERPGVSTVIQRISRQVENGSVIVLHDGYYGGQDVAQTTAQLIPQLLQHGYEFVTIDQFWRQRS